MKKKILVIGMLYLLSVPALRSFASQTHQLGGLVVTPSRMAQNDYKIASNVTVITQEDIASSNAQTVAEILQQKPGVNIYDNSTYKTAKIDIRGFGDTASRNILVLVNDRKINSIDVSGADLMQIPLGSVDRIEIIRGAGSVLYGDNAVGGVVNIITKTGEGDLSGKTGLTYGSYETLTEEVQVSGGYRSLGYYFYSRYSDSDGYRLNSGLRAKDASGRVTHKYSDKLTLDVSAGWHEDKNGLPGGLSEEEMQGSGRRGSADPNDFGTTEDAFVQLGADFYPWLGDHDWGHFVIDGSFRRRETFGVFAAFDFGTQRDIDTYSITGKYIYDQTLFGNEVNFVTGIDYYNVENDITGTGSNSDDITISKEEVGVYTFGEFETLKNLFVSAGSRFQKAYYTFDQRSGTPNVVKQDPYESVSSAGLKYEYGKGSSIFASIQQSFRFLATDEWYNTFSGLNTNLSQQTGLQYEAGLRHNFNDVTVVSATPYLMDLKNEIFFDPTAGFFGVNNNYDKTRRIGVEVDQTTDLLQLFPNDVFEQLDIFANYTYQNPEFREGPNDGKQIPMAPEHQASIGTRAKFLEYFSMTLIGRFVGERFAINDTLNTTAKIKPYYVLDGRLAFHWKLLEIIFALNNITDEQYYTFVSKAATSTRKDYFPAPERNASVTVNLKF